MRLIVAAVGRLRGGPEAELVEDYAARIRAVGRGVGVGSFDIREVEAPKGLNRAARTAKESALLVDAARGASPRVALDEGGEDLSSEAFAARLGRWRDGGAAEIAFLIGGAEGHDKSLLDSAQHRLAFGRATFPHLLVRIMLVEQIYRAVTILSGHPYHRA